jgi:hypothetical protein
MTQMGLERIAVAAPAHEHHISGRAKGRRQEDEPAMVLAAIDSSVDKVALLESFAFSKTALLSSKLSRRFLVSDMTSRSTATNALTRDSKFRW